MVRQRSRTGQGKAKRSLIRKDSSGSISEQLPSRDDGIVLIFFDLTPWDLYSVGISLKQCCHIKPCVSFWWNN